MALRLLLDTHVFMWALYEPKRLSRRVTELIRDVDNTRFVSGISAYEIALLAHKGRALGAVAVATGYSEHLDRLKAVDLPVTALHSLTAGRFARVHKDPFDRIIAAQGMLEGFTVATRDPQIAQLGAVTVW